MDRLKHRRWFLIPAALGTLAEQTGYVPDGTTLALANQIQILVTGLIGLWGAARARQPIIGD